VNAAENNFRVGSKGKRTSQLYMVLIVLPRNHDDNQSSILELEHVLCCGLRVCRFRIPRLPRFQTANRALTSPRTRDSLNAATSQGSNSATPTPIVILRLALMVSLTSPARTEGKWRRAGSHFDCNPSMHANPPSKSVVGRSSSWVKEGNKTMQLYYRTTRRPSPSCHASLSSNAD
jgi:hypothetical protein